MCYHQVAPPEQAAWHSPCGRPARPERYLLVLRSGAVVIRIPAREGEKWYLNTRISGPFRQTTNQAMPTLKPIQADAIAAPNSFI
jgi:hypothetical protein